ncbi:hypothetical protein PINS_up017852 [Pythium insidiosum]|nr:hypothetical protein PINS_up017852 [Pythium insidiosum]
MRHRHQRCVASRRRLVWRAETAAARCRSARRTTTLCCNAATAVPEYNIEALELEHARTKARYVHIDAKDPNNVFSVMFRTPPASSNGIAHILEHTTLCGSRQFPVRDPFFNMIKRSLNTYMNALTAYDHTMYPFSTREREGPEEPARGVPRCGLLPEPASSRLSAGRTSTGDCRHQGRRA